MGWTFRKSIGLLPGVRLNLSKGGIGLSFGVKGARISIGPRGARRTIGVGGVYHTEAIGTSGPKPAKATNRGILGRFLP